MNTGDEITLSGLVFFGRHGVNPEETTLGQRFGAELTILLDLTAAGESDDVADTVSYSSLYKIVRGEIEGTPSKLLEHLAARVARKVLSSDKRIETVKVSISKLNPPLNGSVSGSATVTISRNRDWLTNGEEN